MRIDVPIPGQLPALRALWEQCFSDPPPAIDAFFRTGFSYERCRCVTESGSVAAALYWFDASCRGARLAYLYAVGTAPAFRGRGLCRALMEDTHRHLTDMGYNGAVLVPASQELFSLYEKLGYRTFSGIRQFSCTAFGEPVPLQRIEQAQYAEKRRQMLPKDAVLQEGPALDYLQTMASFYAGNGFLLAAGMEGDTLLVQEFLGDISDAPGILAALGAARGQFRMPGQDKPFAMYFSLTQGDPPGYFGLALD